MADRPDVERPELTDHDALEVLDHEVANAAAVLVGLARTLRRRWDQLDDTGRRELAERLATEAERLPEVLETMRRWRRSETQPPSAGMPRPMLERLADNLRALVRGRPIDVELAPDLPDVPLDESLLQQVLVNLVLNAARHSAPGSELRLRARATADALRIEVEDTGPGVPPERRDAVFEKFVRVNPRAPSGRGLGLFISRRLLAGLGGRVWLEGGAQGGTRAVVEIPRQGAGGGA